MFSLGFPGENFEYFTLALYAAYPTNLKNIILLQYLEMDTIYEAPDYIIHFLMSLALSNNPIFPRQGVFKHQQRA